MELLAPMIFMLTGEMANVDSFFCELPLNLSHTYETSGTFTSKNYRHAFPHLNLASGHIR